MAKSSIHIIAVKTNSELHNKRLKEYDYVRQELTPFNEIWEQESLSCARQRIETTYEKNVGQKMQSKMNPLREGVLNLNPEHTMEDLHRLREVLFEQFGIKTIQMYIHRDEGYMKSKEWKQNLHAHLIFDWTDEKGKSLKLKRQEMTQLQDVVSEVLEMERGQKSNKKHLGAIAYKIQQIEENIAQKQLEIGHLVTQWEFYKELETSANVEDYIQKGFLGLNNKINKEKLNTLIRSEKAKTIENKNLVSENKKIIKQTENFYQQMTLQINSLEKERENLEKDKTNLEAEKSLFFRRMNNLIGQEEKVKNFDLKMAEFNVLKQKFERIKDFEGINYSRSYLDYCVKAQNFLDEILIPQILQELTERQNFRNKLELEKTLVKEFENKGLKYFDTTKEIFEQTEQKMGIEYRPFLGRKR
ncbi:MAG: hypothetical protein Q4A58_07960, partial [Fusobacterium sp.]|uniref:hypothetical protein n=1 Tax=Fusobacterium sp. TaxID=68766 RepID=UPI0026DD13A7